jgi:hypothetical protein
MIQSAARSAESVAHSRPETGSGRRPAALLVAAHRSHTRLPHTQEQSAVWLVTTWSNKGQNSTREREQRAYLAQCHNQRFEQHTAGARAFVAHCAHE